jgi:hypothetical protein
MFVGDVKIYIKIVVITGAFSCGKVVKEPVRR